MIRGVALWFLLAATAAWGYPELVRHGYQRCNVCHVSPDGGGLVTPYGRALSREILSTWGEEKEGDFAYGLIPLPEALALGGELRVVQTHKDTATTREGNFILMEADAEAALKVGDFTVSGTFGYQSEVLSRRHFVQWKPGDHWSLRAGRFFKAYGIHLPDHIVEIRRRLGWDEGTETYNVEGAYFVDGGEVFATAQFGRPDKPSLNSEKGAALRGALNLGDRYKVGASYFYGNRPGIVRHVAGPYAILGFGTHVFLLAEVDLQTRRQGGVTVNGGASYLRLGYEPIQGVVPFLAHEYSQLDFKAADTRRVLYTAGVQWFPRPHFELLGAYQRMILSPVAGGNADFLWIMGHFYL